MPLKETHQFFAGTCNPAGTEKERFSHVATVVFAEIPRF
jgi:hypothetical protein